MCSRERVEIGRQFASVDEVKDCIKKYNRENFTEYRVRTNNKRSLLFNYKHGRHRDSKSQNIRPGTHFNFSGCQHRSVSTSPRLVMESLPLNSITSHLEHTGHAINEEVYNLHNTNLTDEELNKCFFR